MNTLQEQVIGYLKTLGFGFPEVTEDFLVADKTGYGGTRDTLLIWVPSEPEDERDIPHLARRLLREFRGRIRQYPHTRRFTVAHTFGGFSQEFRDETERFDVHLRVPIQFFDAPFKYEEAPEETQSAIKVLRDPVPRIPQPYSILADSESHESGGDLLEHLWKEFRFSEGPSLRIVVGPAGIGKTWLFRVLFHRLYRHFLDQKLRQETFPRPIPLISEYLRGAGTLRTPDLVNSFIRTEVVSPVQRATFEWMVINGYASWLFDGLDELYAEDQDFFYYLTDLLTRPESQAQILICARESLLTSCEAFTEFLNDYGMDPAVHMYRLAGWERPSKRAFARLHFDPPKDSEFLTYISRSDSLESLSSLPYYCDLLRKEFEQGKLEEFTDDFALAAHTVSEIIEREKDKGLLNPEDFQPHGLNEWLETVAAEFHTTNFRGIDRADMETYAMLVLNAELSEEERQNAITTLIQFPLFAPGLEPGVLAFEHELIAEYLAGHYWLRRLISDPGRVARELGTQVDFGDSFIARYMASQIPTQPRGIQNLVEALRMEALPGRAFTNLLQLLLLASPAKDLLTRHKVVIKGCDLSQVRFIARDIEGYSFTNCNLSSTVFRECNLRDARFEGSRLEGTRFEEMSEGALVGARFGNLERFEFVYVDRKRIEDRSTFAKWIQEVTGQIDPITQPCPSALQLRTLLLKFVRPDGTGRRDELPERALTRGKRYPEAPTPEACVKACLSFGYLQRTRWHDRIRRIPGDQYNDMIHFVKDWQLPNSLREMLDFLCPITGCEHVPEPR